MIDRTKLLCDLVKIRSVTGDIAEVNRCVEFLRARLEAEGLFCEEEVFDGGRKALWASNVPSRRPDLMLVVHLDVVPADAEAEFEPVVDGDIVRGRGTLDCKGNAVAAVMALMDVAADSDSGASIGVVFSTDEETGGATTLGMVERGYGAAKAAVVYDDSCGTDICIGQKGIVVIRLTAEGRGGHASRPWNYDNPVYTLAEAIVKLRAYWDGKYPHEAGKEWHNTVAPCVLSAGKADNQIPDTATAMLNIRFTENSTPEGVAEEVRAATGLKAEITTVSPCVFFPPDGEAIKILSEVISENFDGAHVGHRLMNGATDARHLASLGVPVAVTGIHGDGAHQADEYASLSSIDRFARIAATFARRL